MTSAREIIFVTGNANKLKEVKMILAPSENEPSPSFTIVNEALDLEELQDIDLEAIALAKCKQAVQILGPGRPVFVEDTALRFDEFNGLPGAYIKWFVKSMGLAKIVQMLQPFENKGAEAVTTIVYADGKGQYHTFQGITRGTIVDSRGPTTFGWDSIFQPIEGKGQTYAEMEKKDKNLISQRGRAFAQLKDFLYNSSDNQ
ncbi:nucleoside triphosphate pyrophosphohydrolase HAM1 NDAI_0D01490 [Naumovozyma dairenensis CBS 421]|uniref:Inosine triphosphate pyrophosphatase n=1 Tax=Naumovozyma dairenensis (strain ATCC 10597 / BCRC 20456 / CBS 421 / NBRC 0211 / NRRL Y-12639) TaxID=1071378 RepID=G0W9K2_NAUDC|nr:hypothetical protein NDAI_0D01490 [Naumovozyma dairenensis CBS 421]CCD24463.1 hypothetical protein NDAI_0D01490 [Naumovozyma dairenensis CBS 421]